jgi:hypothetical protein
MNENRRYQLWAAIQRRLGSPGEPEKVIVDIDTEPQP